MTARSWRSGVTRYQWLVLFIAWLGWVFDAMDATIYAIVLHPALHDLLQSPDGPVSSEQVGWYGGIIFSIFLIGWAIGDRKSTRLNSSHIQKSRMPSSA